LPTIDLITALGRLLSDGSLRDAFAADPLAVAAAFGLRENDLATFTRLAPDDLEFQALVLLRKRFEAVRRVIPSTCSRLGGKGWARFQAYARMHRFSGTDQPAREAHGFCQRLLQLEPEALCDFEWNRLCFVLGGSRVAAHFVRGLPIRNSPRLALQCFLRGRRSGCRELALYFGL